MRYAQPATRARAQGQCTHGDPRGAMQAAGCEAAAGAHLIFRFAVSTCSLHTPRSCSKIFRPQRVPSALNSLHRSESSSCRACESAAGGRRETGSAQRGEARGGRGAGPKSKAEAKARRRRYLLGVRGHGSHTVAARARQEAGSGR